MELFDRTKAILLNPKEEWEVIEAEDAPHAKVLIGHLLPLAAIPAIAIIVNYYLAFRKIYNATILSLSDSDNKVTANSVDCFKEGFSFADMAKWGIIDGLTTAAVIVGSIYASTFIINALADKFGAEKNFDRAFSLAAYSFTPLCVAGIMYAVDMFVWAVPYIGLYGLYILYMGVQSQMKPLAKKLSTFCIIAVIVAGASWYLLDNKVVPEIRENIVVSLKEDSINEYSKEQKLYKDLPYGQYECKQLQLVVKLLDYGCMYMQMHRKLNEYSLVNITKNGEIENYYKRYYKK